MHNNFIITNMNTFTTLQILHAIATWKHESFTLSELNFLINYFCGQGTDNTIYEYGSPDIESFILETLSEMPED